MLWLCGGIREHVNGNGPASSHTACAPEGKPSLFFDLYLPAYPNRATASRLIQRKFNEVLEQTGLKHDAVTNTDHSIYSLRHTAICMRIILSRGKVNIFNLAKNAGTSVEQIELLCQAPAALARDGEEPAELWGRVTVPNQLRLSGPVKLQLCNACTCIGVS
jgi:hypothetical protein